MAVSLRFTLIAFFNHFCKIAAIPVFMIAAAGSSSAATANLSRLSCASNAFSAPGTDACSVYLTSRTHFRTYVTLSSNNPAVAVPKNVVINSRAESARFSATVATVTTTQTATITAQVNGLSASFKVTISPSTATGSPALKVNATSISFGAVALNSLVSQPLTVSSTGTAPLTLNSAVVNGAGFSVSGVTLPTTLNPGQSLALEVQFDPTTATSYSGQLTIGTNASNPLVALSGTGTSYEVDLNWSAPTNSTDPVTGYNVYRAPSGTTSFQRLNANTYTLTTYKDPSVQAGASYDYYVTSVDAQGVESIPSQTFSTTIL